MQEYGTLLVRTTGAGGALPIRDCVVDIRGADEENRTVHLILETDRSGMTPRVKLPCPDKSISLLPEADEAAFATYDITVSGVGYYPKRITGVPLFADTGATQTVTMIPEPAVGGGQTYPRGNLTPDIAEEYEEATDD